MPCLKKKVKTLSVRLMYQFSCLHPPAHGRARFKREYRVCNEIGRGGFGIVYRGYRIADGAPVAIKFIPHKYVGHWTMLERHVVPMEICRLVDCQKIRGVVRLLDWFATRRGFWLVMERFENCMDLFDVVSVYGRLDESSARGIFSQLLDTVIDLKQRRATVHRDIKVFLIRNQSRINFKDENVIVDMDTGQIRLIDFGAAEVLLDDASSSHRFQGTRSYCPPEWFKHHAYLPMEATVWSLGVLLYITVVGTTPFRNEVQICMGKVRFPEFVSKDCQSLIRRCLYLAPEARIPLDEIRRHPWLTPSLESYTRSRKFHAILHKRSLKRLRRRGSGWCKEKEEEDDDEDCELDADEHGDDVDDAGSAIDGDAQQRANNDCVGVDEDDDADTETECTSYRQHLDTPGLPARPITVPAHIIRQQQQQQTATMFAAEGTNEEAASSDDLLLSFLHQKQDESTTTCSVYDNVPTATLVDATKTPGAAIHDNTNNNVNSARVWRRRRSGETSLNRSNEQMLVASAYCVAASAQNDDDDEREESCRRLRSCEELRATFRLQHALEQQFQLMQHQQQRRSAAIMGGKRNENDNDETGGDEGEVVVEGDERNRRRLLHPLDDHYQMPVGEEAFGEVGAFPSPPPAKPRRSFVITSLPQPPPCASQPQQLEQKLFELAAFQQRQRSVDNAAKTVALLASSSATMTTTPIDRRQKPIGLASAATTWKRRQQRASMSTASESISSSSTSSSSMRTASSSSSSSSAIAPDALSQAQPLPLHSIAATTVALNNTTPTTLATSTKTSGVVCYGSNSSSSSSSSVASSSVFATPAVASSCCSSSAAAAQQRRRDAAPVPEDDGGSSLLALMEDVGGGDGAKWTMSGRNNESRVGLCHAFPPHHIDVATRAQRGSDAASEVSSSLSVYFSAAESIASSSRAATTTNRERRRHFVPAAAANKRNQCWLQQLQRRHHHSSSTASSSLDNNNNTVFTHPTAIDDTRCLEENDDDEDDRFASFETAQDDETNRRRWFTEARAGVDEDDDEEEEDQTIRADLIVCSSETPATDECCGDEERRRRALLHQRRQSHTPKAAQIYTVATYGFSIVNDNKYGARDEMRGEHASSFAAADAEAAVLCSVAATATKKVAPPSRISTGIVPRLITRYETIAAAKMKKRKPLLGFSKSATTTTATGVKKVVAFERQPLSVPATMTNVDVADAKATPKSRGLRRLQSLFQIGGGGNGKSAKTKAATSAEKAKVTNADEKTDDNPPTTEKTQARNSVLQNTTFISPANTSHRDDDKTTTIANGCVLFLHTNKAHPSPPPLAAPGVEQQQHQRQSSTTTHPANSNDVSTTTTRIGANVADDANFVESNAKTVVAAPFLATAATTIVEESRQRSLAAKMDGFAASANGVVCHLPSSPPPRSERNQLLSEQQTTLGAAAISHHSHHQHLMNNTISLMAITASD